MEYNGDLTLYPVMIQLLLFFQKNQRIYDNKDMKYLFENIIVSDKDLNWNSDDNILYYNKDNNNTIIIDLSHINTEYKKESCKLLCNILQHGEFDWSFIYDDITIFYKIDNDFYPFLLKNKNKVDK